MTRVVCTGPEGTNLLGMLCSLGALRVLESIWPDRGVALSWSQRAGWRPVFHVDGEADEDSVAAALGDALRARADAPWLLASDSSGELAMNVSDLRREDFRRLAARAREACDAETLGFLAALASDVPDDPEAPIGDTSLRTMGGAGHQHFLGTMRKLAEVTETSHVRDALFRAWRYEDDRLSLRWDPVDDRRYALRADDPSGPPPPTVRGANRLAFEALPLFPCLPSRQRVTTTGFARHDRSVWAIWPIWSVPATSSVVRSLLVNPAVHGPRRDAQRLARMGVADVIEARRTRVGKYVSFTPGRSVLAE